MRILYVKKNSLKNEDELNLFSDNVNARICHPKIYTIRNVKESSLGWREVLPAINTDLHVGMKNFLEMMEITLEKSLLKKSA